MDIDAKFEQNSECNSISGDIYPNVKDAITNIAQKRAYIWHKINKKKISSEGGNYLGVLYEIDIKGETAEGCEEETNFFVKQVIPMRSNVKILSISELYKREIFVYTELAEIYMELQDMAKIPLKKRFKLAKIYDESNTDAVILENMTKHGFKTFGRLDKMRLDYGELCIEYMAKLHGLSFVMERKIPKFYERKIKSLKQQMNFDAEDKEFLNSIYEFATTKLCADLKTKTDKWWKKALENYQKYLDGEMTEVKCLCHGDFKMNNTMYKEIEGEVTEVIAVDYQTAHYGSPILDLLYFIYMGTDLQFRRKHLDHLKDHYYVSLRKYLDYFEILIDDVYPRKMFERDFEDSVNYAVLCCIWILPLAMTSQDEDYNASDFRANEPGKTKFCDEYYNRISDILDDYFKSNL